MNTLLLYTSAFGLGMLHAIEPGHGKSLVTVYLVGKHSTWQQAVALGLVVAFSHTFSVLALGTASASLIQWWAASQSNVLHWIELIAGALIISVGLMMLWHANRTPATEEHHCHHKHCEVDTIHPPSSLKEIFMLGIASGFCPSPLPLILLVTSLSLGGFGQLAQAVGYLFAFSLGLASIITVLGVALIYSKNRAMPWLKKLPDGWAKRFNQASALLIILLGLYLMLFVEVPPTLPFGSSLGH